MLPTDVPYYEIDGRQPIYQRVTRELRGFLPLDPAARLATWKLILDPPVKDVERNAFFMPDRDAPTTPVVDLVSNTPIGMLVWASSGGNPAFSAGLYLQGARGSYYMLGQQAYVGIDAAAQLSKTEIVIAKRGDSGASLCTATRKTCEPRLERPGLSTDALAIARAPDGELALVDFARNGAAPALHRGTDAAPRELPPVSGLVAASDSRCAGTAEWAVVGRASVLKYEATTYPSWLLMRLVGATWCVDAVDYWRGPLNRVVARFGAQPEAARYEFTDDSAAVVRTPVGCVIEPAR